MRNILTVALSASILSLSASALMAQTQSPDGDKRALPPDGQVQAPYNKKEQPTNDVTKQDVIKQPGAGTRALMLGEGNSLSPAPTATPGLTKLGQHGRGGRPE